MAPIQQAVVNMSELSRREAANPIEVVPEKKADRHLKGPGPRPIPPGANVRLTVMEEVGDPATKAPAVASPSPSASFLALEDNNASIPPDTHGSVGPNHLMVTLNTQVRTQTKTGTNLTTVSLDSFWASLGNPNAFDPKVLYDPFNNRWIFTCVADAASPQSSVLLGVSQTSDPTGNWNLYKTDGDSADQVWADYPSMGFNKDWIAVQVNMFTNSNNSFSRSHIYVFTKSAVYAGGQTTARLFQDSQGFAQVPATTLDNTLGTLYLVDDWNGNFNGQGFLRLNTITGPVGSEVYTANVAFIGVTNTWRHSSGSSADFGPQLGSTNKIDVGDSRFQTLTYRNGSLFGAHTVFLPVASAANRSSVQWYEINPTTGQALQNGRIDDSSGQTFYAYPSVAVNKNKDVLIGYAKFAASIYGTAAYAFRLSTATANTLQSETVLKSGEAPYFKTFGGSSNRWGDYSHTSVDPTNDTDLWTIQEYAAMPSGGFDRWGTWWGKVVPGGDTSAQNPALTFTLDKASYTDGESVVATEFRIKNPNTTPTQVFLQITLAFPGGNITLASLGQDGSFYLPANLDQNAGPVSVFQVNSAMPRGSYSLNSRITNPITNVLMSEDLNPFTIASTTGSGLDGKWVGTLSTGRVFEFDVSNNAVTRMRMAFSFTSAGSTCTATITITATTGNILANISNNSFSYNFKPTGLQTDVTVNFTSNTAATGTFGTVTLTNYVCGSIITTGTQPGGTLTANKQ